jgi:ribonuclease HI
MLEIYTDGSSRNNGAPNCTAGWSSIIRNLNGTDFVRYGHLEAPSSNNRGEIFGVYYVCWLLKPYPELLKETTIKFYSDSQYVVKSINEWRHNWKKKNYSGVKNADLFVPLFDFWDTRKNLSIEWVRGHNGNEYNEIADYYAGAGADKLDLSCNTENRVISYVNSKEIIL